MSWDKLDLSLCDPNICPYFCAKLTSPPSCDEEHEAWHAAYIQAELTFDEYKAWKMKEAGF